MTEPKMDYREALAACPMKAFDLNPPFGFNAEACKACGKGCKVMKTLADMRQGKDISKSDGCGCGGC